MAALFDIGVFSAEDIDGGVIVGAKLYWYTRGTSTPKITYSDRALTVPNTNPVIANAAGRFGPIWLDDDGGKFILTDADGDPTAPLITRDDVCLASSPIMTGTQSFTAAPLGNSGSTKTSRKLEAATSSGNANAREFMDILSLSSSHGYGGTPANDKVTQYRSFVAAAGSADGWVGNDLFRQETNDTINAHVVEFDFDMISNNKYGTTAAGAGLVGGTLAGGGAFATGSAHGVVVTGIATGTGTITSAFTAASGTNMFQRGFTAAVGCIQAGFEEVSAASSAFRSAGANADGLNTVLASYSGAAVLIGNTQAIQSLTSGGARRTLLKMDASSNLLLGTDTITAATNVLVGSSILPVTDNVVQVGGAGARYTAIWAVNGAIQTSDPSEKVEIAPISIDIASRIMDSIDPITFKWKIGGRDLETEHVTDIVHATEIVKNPIQPVEIINGMATLCNTERLIEEFIYDDVPLFNADGSPVIIERHGAPTGIQASYRMPRMVEKVVERPVYRDRPGKRTHWGWNAEQVRDAFASQGVDFGGFIEAEDGLLALRPDQLVPVLWAAVKGLAARIATLEDAHA